MAPVKKTSSSASAASPSAASSAPAKGPKSWRQHPWSPALFTALGILLALACILLFYGIYRVVSTYFFIFVAAICLSEALWQPKMAMKGVLDILTASKSSPRAFLLRKGSMATAALLLALLAARYTPRECAIFAGLWALALALDRHLGVLFRLHRWLLTDDDLVALFCMLGLLLACILGIALPALQVAGESAELASQVGGYSQYLPELRLAEAVKSLGVEAMVRDMGKGYENATWYDLVNRTVHEVAEGDFDLSAKLAEWQGNATTFEALQRAAENVWREIQGLEAMPSSELAKQGAQVASTTLTSLLFGLQGTLGIGLSIAATLTDKTIRVMYFLSLLFYFLGRKHSLLQVLLEMLGDESELGAEIQDILSGIFKYPAARLVGRFWSTCILAYIFGVKYTWMLSALTMLVSFAPLSVGAYPYLTAIPWWLSGTVQGGVFNGLVPSGILKALPPFGPVDSPEAFWFGALFMIALVVVHTILDSLELAQFSVSRHVPPYVIGLAVLLGFEHFGIWALFYCPLLLCALALAYRICIKGEFLAAASSEGGEDEGEAEQGSEEPDEEPDASLLQVTRRVMKRVTIVAKKVHDRSSIDASEFPLKQRSKSLFFDTPSPKVAALTRRGTFAG